VLFKATASEGAEVVFAAASVDFDSAGIADDFGSAVSFNPDEAVTVSGADFVSLAGVVSDGAVTNFVGALSSAAVSVAGFVSAAGIVIGGAATLSVAGFESVVEFDVGGTSVLGSDSLAIGCFAFGLAGGGAEIGAGTGSGFDPEAGLPFAFSVGTVAGASSETAGFASTTTGSIGLSLGVTGLDSDGAGDAVLDVSGGG
jgi:hypothetical protein